MAESDECIKMFDEDSKEFKQIQEALQKHLQTKLDKDDTIAEAMRQYRQESASSLEVQ